MRREKRAVAGNSVLAALVITSLKIVVGSRPDRWEFCRRRRTPASI